MKVNKRSLIALFVGIFIGFYLFQAFLIMEFVTDFIGSLQFMFAVHWENRIFNTTIMTAISMLIITMIDPKILLNTTQKESTKE